MGDAAPADYMPDVNKSIHAVYTDMAESAESGVSVLNGTEVIRTSGKNETRNTAVEEIVLSPSVVALSAYAFSEFLKLRKTDMSESYTEVVQSVVFGYCAELDTAHLPGTVKRAESTAFTKCKKLVSLYSPPLTMQLHYELFYID